MKHVLVSLLMIAVGAFGLINADAMRDVYDTLYPTSAAKADVVDYCANIGLNFGKMTDAQREDCHVRAHGMPPAVRVSSPLQR